MGHPFLCGKLRRLRGSISPGLLENNWVAVALHYSSPDGGSGTLTGSQSATCSASQRRSPMAQLSLILAWAVAGSGLAYSQEPRQRGQDDDGFRQFKEPELARE